MIQEIRSIQVVFSYETIRNFFSVPLVRDPVEKKLPP